MDNKLAKAWRKQLASAHVAVMAVRAEATDEHFHELRKEAQTYWMFCALVADIWPTALKAKRADAKALADLIGHEHDLSVMIALLDGPDAPALSDKTHRICREEAIAQRARLRTKAVRDARRVFGEEVESDIVKTLWRERVARGEG